MILLYPGSLFNEVSSGSFISRRLFCTPSHWSCFSYVLSTLGELVTYMLQAPVKCLGTVLKDSKGMLMGSP